LEGGLLAAEGGGRGEEEVASLSWGRLSAHWIGIEAGNGALNSLAAAVLFGSERLEGEQRDAQRKTKEGISNSENKLPPIKLGTPMHIIRGINHLLSPAIWCRSLNIVTFV
jgi:hypothetical protein